MTVTDASKVLELLKREGYGDEWLEANHDVIYLPVMEEDVSFKAELEELGAIWDSSFDCWCIYC